MTERVTMIWWQGTAPRAPRWDAFQTLQSLAFYVPREYWHYTDKADAMEDDGLPISRNVFLSAGLVDIPATLDAAHVVWRWRAGKPGEIEVLNGECDE